jgi:hypothetical protein
MILRLFSVLAITALLTACAGSTSGTLPSGPATGATTPIAATGFTRVEAPLKRLQKIDASHIAMSTQGATQQYHIPQYTGLTPADFAALKRQAKHSTQAPHPAALKAAPFPGTASSGPPVSLQVSNGMGLCAGGTFCFFPSDDALAASPTHVLQVINGGVAVYDSAGMLQDGWPKSAPSFFGTEYGACSGFLFDPRALYDTADQRFFVTMIEDEGGADSACPTERLAWIAVSDTSDPAGAWHIYTYDLSGTTSPDFGIDYTRIGVDARGFYLSVNNQAAAICSIDKHALENGVQANAFCFANLTFDGVVTDSMQPVLTLANSGAPPPVEFFVESENIHFGGGQCRDGCSGIIVWALANPGTAAATLTSALVPSSPYILPPFADQPGCSQCVNSADTRISGTPVWSNGVIAFGLDTGVNNGTQVVPGILWGELQPKLDGDSVVGGSLRSSGYLYFNGANAASFPAMMPDGSGDLFMVFDFMGPSTYPSVALTHRLIASGGGSFFAPQVVKLGTGSTTSSSWGDYSAASYDGAADVWVVSQYGDSSGGFGTALGKAAR